MALPLTLVLVQIKCSSIHRGPAALLLRACTVLHRACTVLHSATQYYTVLLAALSMQAANVPIWSLQTAYLQSWTHVITLR